MNGKLSKKLRKIANEELRGMQRSEREIIDAHANYLSINKPRFIPGRVWRWIVKKVIYRT